jgi:hypothetical protein
LPQEFSRDFADTPGPSLSPAILDCDILSHNPAEFAQTCDKTGCPRTPDRRTRAKESDTPWFTSVLRVGRKRPCRKTSTKTFDEFPPLHEPFPAEGYSEHAKNIQFSIVKAVTCVTPKHGAHESIPGTRIGRGPIPATNQSSMLAPHKSSTEQVEIPGINSRAFPTGKTSTDETSPNCFPDRHSLWGRKHMLDWLIRRNAPARVAVIESLPVDGKRSVILARRDNIEHLVMVGGRNDLVIEPNIMRRPAPNPARRPALGWKGLPPAPTREPLAEPEKLTRRLEAELRGSPPLRRQRTENPGRDPIQEAVPDDIAEKDPAR